MYLLLGVPRITLARLVFWDIKKATVALRQPLVITIRRINR